MKCGVLSNTAIHSLQGSICFSKSGRKGFGGITIQNKLRIIITFRHP